jgi:hypothetical protein
VVYSLFSYHQKNLGGPGSSRGTLERIRAGLTKYIVNAFCSETVQLHNLVYLKTNFKMVSRTGYAHAALLFTA